MTSSLGTVQSSAIRDAKKELRESIGDVEKVFAEVDAHMKKRVAEIVAKRERGEEVFPTVAYADIAAGTVSEAKRAEIVKAGCVVVRQTFERSEAEAWDEQIVEYLDRNDFTHAVREWSDTTMRPGGQPLLFPIHWSKPQVQARQDPRLNATRAFLNSMWKTDSEGQVWFDGSRETAFGDRIRRRQPGDSFPGLNPHVDGGASGPVGDAEVGAAGRWTSPGGRRVYRHVFSGDWEKYDPWDAAYRTDPATFKSFRSFQGWTALSEMRPNDGVLHVVPIAETIVYGSDAGSGDTLGLGRVDLDCGDSVFVLDGRQPAEAVLRKTAVVVPFDPHDDGQAEVLTGCPGLLVEDLLLQ